MTAPWRLAVLDQLRRRHIYKTNTTAKPNHAMLCYATLNYFANYSYRFRKCLDNAVQPFGRLSSIYSFKQMIKVSSCRVYRVVSVLVHNWFRTNTMQKRCIQYIMFNNSKLKQGNEREVLAVIAASSAPLFFFHCWSTLSLSDILPILT